MNISPTLLIILLFVVIGTASSAAIAIFILVPLSRARQQNRQLLENGHPAIAEALSVRQTGLLVNNMPQVRMGLRVHPPDSAPFTLELVRVLAFTAIPKYVEGAVI